VSTAVRARSLALFSRQQLTRWFFGGGGGWLAGESVSMTNGSPNVEDYGWPSTCAAVLILTVPAAARLPPPRTPAGRAASVAKLFFNKRFHFDL